MKKIIVVLMSVVLLVCGKSYVSQAGPSVPTSQWDLRPTAYMEQMGIFTDLTNHRGIYPYSAYFSTSTLYSNYYFKAYAANRYYITGHRTSSENKKFFITMYSLSGSGHVNEEVNATTTYFVFDYNGYSQNLTDQAYFYFDGSGGAEFSVNGHLETYN